VLAEHLTSPGLLLALLGHAAMRRLRAAHTAVGLTPRQFQLLGVLQDRGPMGQRELGEAMGIDPSILVTMLNPLEDGRLVKRARDPHDRRRHVVTLTAAGDRKLERAAAEQRAAEDELFSALGDEQREQLRGLLIVLRDAAECSPPRSAEAGDCLS
jgi:DNA-binding MarR family transcriptional regulator